MTNFVTKERLNTRVTDALANSNHSVVTGSPLVAHTQSASSDNIEIKYFASDHDNAPRSADYFNRVKSLINAAKLLAKNAGNAEAVVKLTTLFDQTKEILNIECNVDKELDELKEKYQIKHLAHVSNEDLLKEYKKERLKIIQKINKNFNEILFRIIWGSNKPGNFFTRLLRPITKSLLGDVFAENIIKFIRRPDETHSSAIARLKAAEVELVKMNGRPELVNVFFAPEKRESVSELYYTYQAPISRYTDEQREILGPDIKKDEYFYPASVNNSEGVANFNREVLGKINGDHSEILTKFNTHCALPPLGIKDDLKRLGITARNAEQIVGILAEQRLAEALAIDPSTLENNDADNPLAVDMTEIRLLSLMRNNFIFDFFDKSQHQYEQTLEMFLAFNMFNNKTFQTTVTTANGVKRKIYIKPNIRFGNFGVNGFRNEIFADELLDFINVRYLNQVLATHISELVNEEDATMLPSISSIYLATYETAENAQKTLDAQFHKLHQSLKDAEGNPAAIQQYQEQRKTVMGLLKAQHKTQKILLNHQKDFIHQISKINTISLDSASQARIEHLIQIKELIETPLHSMVENAVSKVKSFGFIPQAFKDFLSRTSVSLGNVFDKYFCFLKRYTFAENNYHLQTILARLNDAEGRELLIGCRENKDRGGRMNATLMNDAIYKDQYGHYANYAKPADKSVFNRLLAWVLPRSTAFFNSELCSVPGARGFDIQASHGNEPLDFLRENKTMARWGKDVFSTVSGFGIVDAAITVKNWVAKKFSRPEPAENTNGSPRPRRNYNTFAKASSLLAAGTLAAALSIASVPAPAAGSLTGTNADQTVGISDLATSSQSDAEASGLDSLKPDFTNSSHSSRLSRIEARAGEMANKLEHEEKQLSKGEKKTGKKDEKLLRDRAKDPDSINQDDVIAIPQDDDPSPRRKDKTKPETPEPEAAPTPDVDHSTSNFLKDFSKQLRKSASKTGKLEPNKTVLHSNKDSPHPHSGSPAPRPNG